MPPRVVLGCATLLATACAPPPQPPGSTSPAFCEGDSPPADAVDVDVNALPAASLDPSCHGNDSTSSAGEGTGLSAVVVTSHDELLLQLGCDAAAADPVDFTKSELLVVTADQGVGAVHVVAHQQTLTLVANAQITSCDGSTIDVVTRTISVVERSGDAPTAKVFECVAEKLCPQD